MTRISLAALLCLSTLSLTPACAEENPEGPPPVARGLLLQHADRLIFSPCRERSYVSVVDESPNQAVTTTLQKLGLNAQTPVYVELLGQAESGSLRVTGLNLARLDARCYARQETRGPWQAAGQDPHWRLRTDGHELTLELAGNEPLSSKFTEELTTPQVSQLKTTNTPALSGEIKAQTCTTTSGEVTGWTIKARYRGTELNGCAWRP